MRRPTYPAHEQVKPESCGDRGIETQEVSLKRYPSAGYRRPTFVVAKCFRTAVPRSVARSAPTDPKAIDPNRKLRLVGSVMCP